MKPPLYLVYLDRYHQGDPLFVQELAQRFARATPGQVPALLLHTGGEKLERTLEAEGVFPERREGVIVAETPRQAALAERAAREAGQELVSRFADEQVSAVSLPGADRGLLRQKEAGGQESVVAGTFGWVGDLVKMQVLPVLSALAQGPSGRAEAVPPGRAAAAVAGALGGDFAVTVCFFADGAEAASPGREVGLDTLAAMHSEPEAVRSVAEADIEVLLTDLRQFFGAEAPQGRRWKKSEERSAEAKTSEDSSENRS